MKITYNHGGKTKTVTLDRGTSRQVLRLLSLEKTIPLGTPNRKEMFYDSIINDYPLLKVIKDYFSKYKSRNAYYIIMKQYCSDIIFNNILAEDPRRSYPLVAYIIGVRSHATIYNLLKKITPESRHADYESVAGVTQHMISQKLYPKIKGFTVDKNLNPHDDYDRITLYKWEQL
jgi:hypothetical protein